MADDTLLTNDHEPASFIYRRVIRNDEGDVVSAETTLSLKLWDAWVDALILPRPNGSKVELYATRLTWGNDQAEQLEHIVRRHRARADVTQSSRQSTPASPFRVGNRQYQRPHTERGFLPPQGQEKHDG